MAFLCPHRLALALAAIALAAGPAGSASAGPADAGPGPHGPATARIYACFVPADSCVAPIVAAIAAARAEIRVQAYGFTSAPILGALAAAKARGADVQVILDKSNDRRASDDNADSPRTRYSGATYMANTGIPVWIDHAPAIAHNKLIVIDGRLVIGGSYNYTIAAERRNAENVTFIDSPEVAAWFLANWASRRDASYPFRSEAAGTGAGRSAGAPLAGTPGCAAESGSGCAR